MTIFVDKVQVSDSLDQLLIIKSDVVSYKLMVLYCCFGSTGTTILAKLHQKKFFCCLAWGPTHCNNLKQNTNFTKFSGELHEPIR